jgi:hypothetical protein
VTPIETWSNLSIPVEHRDLNLTGGSNRIQSLQKNLTNGTRLQGTQFIRRWIKGQVVGDEMSDRTYRKALCLSPSSTASDKSSVAELP